MKFKTFVVLISAFFASAGAFALPNPCNKTFDDSTCMGPRAVRNMPITVPTVVTRDVICGLIDCNANQTMNTNYGGTGIPAGYHEVTIATGPHFVNQSGGLNAEYYKSIGYPIYLGGPYDNSSSNIITACKNDINTRRVIHFAEYIYYNEDSVTPLLSPEKDIVCEPIGTRTTLVKDTQNKNIMFTTSDINIFAIKGTIGVVAEAASAICRAKGYIDATPNSVSSWARGGGCDKGDSITRNTGTGWKTDSACYNSVLTGMQCYK